MVFVKKRLVGGSIQYYLEHSFRMNGIVKKHEKYVGPVLPKNVEELKRRFAREVRTELWYPRLDRIKKGFVAGRRNIPRSVREKAVQEFTVRFTYDTQRIEGSTLTLHETADLLDRRLTPREKPVSDVMEAQAHQSVFQEMLECKKDLSFQLLLEWHHKLFFRTKADIAGRLRHFQVYISGAKHVPPSPVEVHPLLMDMVRWYDQNKRNLHPVELAATMHLKFESIHPFGDGNGRVGRILMNFILHRNGWPMLNIPYKDRRGYYNALERSQVRQHEDVFTHWFFRRYLKENGRYLR